MGRYINVVHILVSYYWYARFQYRIFHEYFIIIIIVVVFVIYSLNMLNVKMLTEYTIMVNSWELKKGLYNVLVKK